MGQLISSDKGSLNNNILRIACEKGDLDILKELLKSETDSNITFSDGETPVSIALHNGHTDILDILFRMGADPNQIFTDGFTPLYVASWRGDFALVQLLLDSGADPNKKTSAAWGPPKSALWVAEQKNYSEIVRLLMEYGAQSHNTIQRYRANVVQSRANVVQSRKLSRHKPNKLKKNLNLIF